MWVSTTAFATERWLISKNPQTDAWQIDSFVFRDLGIEGDAAEWLAPLL